MRLPAYLYLGGMLLLLLSERIFSGSDATGRTALGLVGLLAVLGALGTLLRSGSTPDETGTRQAAHRRQLIFGLVGLSSLLVYLGSTDWFVDRLSLSEDGEANLVTALSTLWPIVWMAGTLPFVAIDRHLAAHPRRVPAGQAVEIGHGWLSAAFAIAMLFPINYIASDTNQRWDLGYFKTAEPGTATIGIIEGMESPVTVHLFFPASSDVTDEIRTYFDQLPQSPNFAPQFVDHALEPLLAEELKVRDNGYIVLVRGEGDDQQVERIRIGTDFDSARRTLKKLDTELFEALMKIASGPRVAYIVVGHNEMFWKSDLNPDRRLNDLKQVLQQLNYQAKELGITQGLATAVPEDASLVLLLSPEEDLVEEELDALNAYRRAGGKLLITLDPGGADLSALLGPLGIEHGDDSLLATDDSRHYYPSSRGPLDRLNIATNKFSTHESVTTLSRNNRTLYTITPGAVDLQLDEAAAEEGVQTNVTVRSMESTWADYNRNLNHDPDETRDSWPIAIAAEGQAAEGDDGYRVVVVGDGTWLSDLTLRQFQGNAQLLLDSLAWLNQEDLTSGTVNDEKDVKIQHTREGQGWIFYSTALLLPLGFLVGGLTRIRLRKKRS